MHTIINIASCQLNTFAFINEASLAYKTCRLSLCTLGKGYNCIAKFRTKCIATEVIFQLLIFNMQIIEVLTVLINAGLSTILHA